MGSLASLFLPHSPGSDVCLAESVSALVHRPPSFGTHDVRAKWGSYDWDNERTVQERIHTKEGGGGLKKSIWRCKEVKQREGGGRTRERVEGSGEGGAERWGERSCRCSRRPHSCREAQLPLQSLCRTNTESPLPFLLQTSHSFFVTLLVTLPASRLWNPTHIKGALGDKWLHWRGMQTGTLHKGQTRLKGGHKFRNSWVAAKKKLKREGERAVVLMRINHNVTQKL